MPGGLAWRWRADMKTRFSAVPLWPCATSCLFSCWLLIKISTLNFHHWEQSHCNILHVVPATERLTSLYDKVHVVHVCSTTLRLPHGCSHGHRNTTPGGRQRLDGISRAFYQLTGGARGSLPLRDILLHFYRGKTSTRRILRKVERKAINTALLPACRVQPPTPHFFSPLRLGAFSCHYPARYRRSRRS